MLSQASLKCRNQNCRGRELKCSSLCGTRHCLQVFQLKLSLTQSFSYDLNSVVCTHLNNPR